MAVPNSSAQNVPCLFSNFLILLVLQCAGRENREVKCTTAFSHVSCSKSHHTDTMRKKVLWCTSLLSLPYLLSCRNLRRKKQNRNQTKNLTKKKPKQTLNLKVSPQSQPMISTGWRFHSRTEQVQGFHSTGSICSRPISTISVLQMGSGYSSCLLPFSLSHGRMGEGSTSRDLDAGAQCNPNPYTGLLQPCRRRWWPFHLCEKIVSKLSVNVQNESLACIRMRGLFLLCRDSAVQQGLRTCRCSALQYQ